MPEFWLIAGINGAGKSSVGSEHPAVKEATGQSLIFNPDLPVYCIQRLLGVSRTEANYAMVVAVEALVERRIQNAESLCVETVLSTKKYLKHIHAARKCGFSVGMIFVALPSIELAIMRVLDRQKLGGHHVPEEAIRRRWQRCHDNLREFEPHIDNLFVYSNATSSPELVAVKRGGVVRVLRRGALPEIDKLF